MDDLYGDHFTVALAQAMSRLECAPYWHQGEKAPARLVRAAELVRLSRVQLHDERTATVHGSTKAYDLTGYHCTCPQSQKGPTHWCVHAVAVKLARTLAEQVRPSDPDDEAYPVDDQTLPLALGPSTIDERLAAPQAAQEPPGGHMTEDPSPYIPEPDDAPVRVVEPQTITIERPGGRPTTVPLPTPVTLPSLDARTLEQSMQAWSAQRQVVKRFLQQELVEGTDYYTLRIKGRETKPALSKAGSEKFMALFQLHAVFDQDTATWTMLGQPQGTLCYRCQLYTRSGEMVGEGRGARTIQQDGGDINKAVKMAQKCLGGTTPILIKSAYGITRTLLNKLEGRDLTSLWIAGPNATWRKIVRVEAQPLAPIRRLLFRDGLQVTASLDHRWPLSDGTLVDTAQLRIGDCIQRSLLPTGTGQADPDFTWMAGLFVAEGYCANETIIGFSLHAHEESIGERLAQIAQRLGASSTLRIDGNKQTVTIAGPAIIGLMEQFVQGRLSYGKHFARALFRQDQKGLASALGGYLEGDGSHTVRPGRQPFWRLGFTRKNHPLAHDLRALAAMLGYRCRIGLGTTAIRKLGKVFDSYNGWIKMEEPRYNGHDLGMIMDISEGQEVTYEVEVDGDHLFCLANGIVTHNSSCVDAILRTGALSDVFTQDEPETPEPPAPARPTAQELRSRIWALVTRADPAITTREDVERYVQRATGYPLHPNRYAEIVSALERSTP